MSPHSRSLLYSIETFEHPVSIVEAHFQSFLTFNVMDSIYSSSRSMHEARREFYN